MGYSIKLRNINYQECITPENIRGHCKHFQYCQRNDLKENVIKLIDYLCIIEKESIGVCCPDNIKNNETPNFYKYLIPDDPPVWKIINNNNNENVPPTQTESIVTRPENRGCGLPTNQFPKLTGGRPADPGEWPWMAAIMVIFLDMPFCGGVLITDRHILTAAHCTVKFKINEYYVRLGEYDFANLNETRFRDFLVSDIRQHIDFDRNTYEHDISVMKLNNPTIFNTYIWPICMPPLGETWEGHSAIITGWGTQFFGGPISKILMEVNVPIWSQKKCQESFAQRVEDTFVCAGAYEGGKDSCQGDSGGPLVVQLPSKRWVIVGVVSWGVRCAEANHPGVYTRVTSYIPWIIENSVF